MFVAGVKFKALMMNYMASAVLSSCQIVQLRPTTSLYIPNQLISSVITSK